MTAANVQQEADILSASAGQAPCRSRVRSFETCKQVSDTLDQWRALCEALRDADELHVVGYSFPDDDAYGHFMLEEARGHGRRAPAGAPIAFSPTKSQKKQDKVAARIARTLQIGTDAINSMGRVAAPDALKWR
jgi:hypothetical protein